MQYADCYFHIFDETIVDGETIEKSVTGLSGSAIKHEIDRRIQFHAIDKSLVSGDQETLFIINQDLFISNGSLSYAQARMDAGADAVLIPLLRPSLEASIELPEQIANSGPDGLSAWRLCDRFPQILHPVSQSLFVNLPEFSTSPTAIFLARRSIRMAGTRVLSLYTCLASTSGLSPLRQYNRLRLRSEPNRHIRKSCHS